MKHTLSETLKLLLWVLLCAVMVPFIAPRVLDKVSLQTENPYIIAGVIISTVLAGAVMWTLVMKYAKKPETLDIAMGIAIGLTLSRMCTMFFGVGTSGNVIDNFLARVAIFAVGIDLYLWVVIKMQKSWASVLKYYVFSNLAMSILLVTVGALLGSMLSPLTAIVVLAAMAVYDAIAVWKLKTMQAMAMRFIDRRIFPGLVVPKPSEEGKFALLGGGDIFFMVLVPVSFYKSSQLFLYASLIGLFLAIVGLFLFSGKGAVGKDGKKTERFYPALPFMFAGMSVACAVAWFLLKGGLL